MRRSPFYDARLSTGSKQQAPKLQLVRRAAIQQRSGEVWENVALALSTAQPAAGTAAVPIGRVYQFDQIAEAHTDMEQNRVSGKLVVTT